VATSANAEGQNFHFPAVWLEYLDAVDAMVLKDDAIAGPAPPGQTGRVALVHDFLVDVRGAERVFAVMADMWPAADLFTAIYDEGGTEGRFADRRVHTSFLQRFHPGARTFRTLLPLYPMAMERLDLTGYDLVVSSSSAWAHGVRAAPRATHVCYCHNPFRYAWSEVEPATGTRRLLGPALAATFERWRRWDRRVSRRVHSYVANSKTTRARILRAFGRDATVVYPPVETERFRPGPVGDHFLVVSELMAHKNIETAVRAFTRLRLPLIIVGDGPEYLRLRRLAGPSVRFAGRLSDAEIASLMSSAQAFVVTAVEEFGIAAVEAQAAGRPVIALDAGGVRETVVEGRTGCFYPSNRPEPLIEVLRTFKPEAYDAAICAINAERFSVSRFQRELTTAVTAVGRSAQAALVPHIAA
jgi:glycosyltransferase involved in cell wall biosynthesis